MGIIIDIVVVAFILASIWMGYKRGLIDCLVKIASFAIAIVLAFVLCAPVGGLIKETTQIDESLSQTIEETLASNVETEEKKEESNMPEVITNYIADQIKSATAQTQDAIAKEVSVKVTDTIINGAAFIGIFLVARFALFFFRKIADIFAKIPLIKQVNELGGVLYGVLRGVFIVYLVLAIISFISALILQTGIIEAINASYITSMLYNNNLLLKIFF